GGISVYYNQIIKAIKATNIEYTILNYENTGCQFISEDVRQPGRYINLYPRFLERYRAVDIPENSLLHSSYYRFNKGKKNKNITTVHDFTYEKYMSGLRKYVHCHQKYNAIKNSDKIICISENTANDLLRYCPVPESKIEIIHNGVSDNFYELKNVNYNDDDNFMLFIGSRKAYKNFQLAVEAINKLEGFKLYIVGGGPLGKAEKFLLDKYIPYRYIHYPYLTEQELNLKFNQAHSLIYPSSYEGFGIPLLEAMRAGCPFIAYNHSSIPEVAGDAGYLMDELSISNLIDGISFINRNRNQIIKKGLSQAQRFSWKKCTDKTIDIYKKLL
ncbi:TPA: glycosyltransferase family 4 protein, partial [Escherichia coli]